MTDSQQATPVRRVGAERFRFDRDVAIRSVAGETATVELSADWNVDGRIINGGYVQAAAVNAARALAGGPPDPIAVSTCYISPARPGPARVTVRVLRAGRTVTATEATVTQDHGTVLVSLATFGRLDQQPDRRSDQIAPPPDGGPLGTVGTGGMPGALPTPGAALPMPVVTDAAGSIHLRRSAMPGAPGLVDLVDMAFVPEASGWLRGDFTAGPRVLVWMCFTDGRPVDTLGLVALADLAPPVAFATGRFGWAPTVQLQVGVFARPSGSPVLLELTGQPYHGAFVAEDGTLWDADGTVLARSRQIALPPRG